MESDTTVSNDTNSKGNEKSSSGRGGLSTTLNNSPVRKVVAVFLIAAIFYTVLFFIMSSINFGADFVGNLTGPNARSHPDIAFYQERTEGILEGQIPYLDFYSESPPLIMYLMVPAALMGGTVGSYAILFSIYVFITAALMVLLLWRIEPQYAIRSATFYLFNPITWITALIFVQDETIVALFYVLPVLLLMIGMVKTATFVSILGAFTKVFSVVLIPLTLIRQKAAEAKKSIVIIVATAAAVCVPFVIAAGEDFIFFIRYYLSQTGEAGLAEGISIWRVLHDVGIIVPGALLQSLLLISTLLMLCYIWKKGIDPAKGAYLLILPFFLFFPKIFTCYFIIPYSVLCLLVNSDRLQPYLITVAMGLAFFVQMFNSYDGEPSVLPMEGLWAILPITAALAMHAILIYIAYRQVKGTNHASVA